MRCRHCPFFNSLIIIISLLFNALYGSDGSIFRENKFEGLDKVTSCIQAKNTFSSNFFTIK